LIRIFQWSQFEFSSQKSLTNIYFFALFYLFSTKTNHLAISHIIHQKKMPRKKNLSTKVRRAFTFADKIDVLDQVEAGAGVRPLARLLKIDKAVISRWRKQEKQIRSLANQRGLDLNKRHRIGNGGRPSTISHEVEIELLSWFKIEREVLREKMTMNRVVFRLRELDQSFVRVPRNICRRRLWTMFHRNDITIRCITHHAQVTRNCGVMIASWGDYVREKMEILDIDHSCICNFDETNVYFSPDCKYTLSPKGVKDVIVNQNESSQRCTAMIGVGGDGYKFPPYIIFKGVAGVTGRIYRQFQRVNAMHQAGNNMHQGLPLSNFYAVQDKAWMNSRLMSDWIVKVIQPWVRSKNGRSTIVILDEFSAHLTSSTKDALEALGCHLVTIPGGYTWRLQVMDVGLNKPFKDYLRDEYDRWQEGADAFDTPDRTDVAKWIKNSFDQLTQSSIRNTWRKVGVPQVDNMAPDNDDEDDEDDEDDDEVEGDEDPGNVMNYYNLPNDEDDNEATIYNDVDDAPTDDDEEDNEATDDDDMATVYGYDYGNATKEDDENDDDTSTVYDYSDNEEDEEQFSYNEESDTESETE
jgi:DDE superfamily endonuclease/CENP-B N-terminal DNA-binding domain